MSGTGSAGMEACFVNLVEPGDTVIIGVNGVFGERMCEVARRCGAEVVRVDVAVGKRDRPAAAARRARASTRKRDWLAVVHAETSTGVENDVAPLAALRDTDTLLLVDMVTSLGGCRSKSTRGGSTRSTRERRSASAFRPGSRPSRSPSARSTRCAAARTPPQSWYLDLGLIADYVGSARVATTTPRRSRCCTRCTLDSACCSRRGSRRRGRATRRSARGCRQRCRSSGSGCSRRSGASRSSPRCGCPKVSTTPRSAASCSAASTSRSAAAWASSPARAGASG